MKIIRYADANNEVAYAWLDKEGQAFTLEGDLFGELRPGSERVHPARLLTPLDPIALIGIGLNYREHARESGKGVPERPVIFLKLPWCAQAPDHPIVLPRNAGRSDKVDAEGELAVIIGRECRNVPEADALDMVLGYTCANDVSARDWQFEWGGGQYSRAKSFDTFCPLGPCLVTADEIPDPSLLRLKTSINGELTQESPVSDLVFSVPQLIAFITTSTTLLPGTVILTGTPSGVGHARKPPRYLSAGDAVAVEIDQIGTLINPVVEEI